MRNAAEMGQSRNPERSWSQRQLMREVGRTFNEMGDRLIKGGTIRQARAHFDCLRNGNGKIVDKILKELNGEPKATTIVFPKEIVAGLVVGFNHYEQFQERGFVKALKDAARDAGIGYDKKHAEKSKEDKPREVKPKDRQKVVFERRH